MGPGQWVRMRRLDLRPGAVSKCSNGSNTMDCLVESPAYQPGQ